MTVLSIHRETMDTHSMFHTLQSSFFNRLMTGNPVIDVCITALLIPITSWLFTTWYEAIKNIVGRVFSRTTTVDQQMIDVPSMSLRRYDYNDVYEDFIWYISHVSPPDQGEFKAFLEDEHIFPVADANVCSTKWKDYEFEYEFYTKKRENSSDNPEKGVHIYHQHPNILPLKQFLIEINELREESENRKEWKQTLCTATDEGWSKPKETHNCKTLETVVLDDGVKESLQEDIETFLASEEWYTSMGLAWNRGYLLSGQSGLGKTTLIKAISYQYKMDIYVIDLANVKSDEALSSLFDSIPPKSMVVLEDIDCMSDITHKRAADDSADDEGNFHHLGPAPPKGTFKFSVSALTLSGLLNVLDGVVTSHGRVLVMTSNHPEKLDPALIRSGRIDMRIFLGLCGREQIRDLFKIYFKEDVLLTELPDCQMSPADVTNIFTAHRLDSKRALAALNLHNSSQMYH